MIAQRAEVQMCESGIEQLLDTAARLRVRSGLRRVTFLRLAESVAGDY